MTSSTFISTEESHHHVGASALDDEGRCPSCEADGVVIGTSLQADVYRCPRCALCYLKRSIRPNSDKENHWYEELRDAPTSVADAFIGYMGRAYAKQVAILERLAPGRDVLDVGPGVGIFLAVAKRLGWKVSGVETSEHAPAFAKKHFDIDYNQSLSDFADGTFSVVRISHVLEHVGEPRPFLQELRRVLKPGGILVVLVPNREPLASSIVNRIRAARSSKPRLSGNIYPDMHVLGFSVESLRNLVESMGFRTVEMTSPSMGSSTYHPMFFDGLLTIIDPRTITLKSMLFYWMPKVFDNLGLPFGKGQWVVGYFRKE